MRSRSKGGFAVVTGKEAVSADISVAPTRWPTDFPSARMAHVAGYLPVTVCRAVKTPLRKNWGRAISRPPVP